jgi:hypothetical protein
MCFIPIGAVYARPYFTQRKLISTHTFKVHWPNWVKFGIREMYIMLFNICEFVKIGAADKAVLFYRHK